MSEETPSEKAIPGAGKGGIIPPVEHRIKPGEVRNPKGRPKAGATIREHMNMLAEKFESGELTRDDLIGIAKADKNPNRSVAAIRYLHSLEYADLSDFDEFMAGEKKLKELRDAGVNTALVKKVNQKSRVVPIGDGETEEIIEAHYRASQPIRR